MDILDLILAVGALAELALIASLVLSIIRPRSRLWPAGRSRGSLAWMWGWTVVATGAGLALVILDYGSGPLDDPAWILLGSASTALGAGLADWGIRTLGQRTSAVLRGRFSSAGPYRWTRNPQYLCDLLMTLGIVIVADSWRAALLGAGGAVCLLLAPLAEERWLSERYGDVFERYRRRVPRLLGRTASHREADAGCPVPDPSRDSGRS